MKGSVSRLPYAPSGSNRNKPTNQHGSVHLWGANSVTATIKELAQALCYLKNRLILFHKDMNMEAVRASEEGTITPFNLSF
jgi:hypothetical protein